MKIVKQQATLVWLTPHPLETIEHVGRVCYKSEDRIAPGTAPTFVAMLLRRGHLAMIEHASMSYHCVTDRGVSHELVRHRLFSYAQESTRYCNYGNQDIQFIAPPMPPECDYAWRSQMMEAEKAYKVVLAYSKPEIARSVLPNSLKTEIVVTGNLREWLHFFALRTAPQAHPQMRELANLILDDAITRVPVIFDALRED
jgi:thymidylate synthase (FAD)